MISFWGSTMHIIFEISSHRKSMQTASVSTIKKELQTLTQDQLIHHCLRLARFRKENKELLTYLIFESFDEAGYVEELKGQISDEFSQINLDSIYYAKKSIRRVLRLVTKHIRFSGIKTTEIELLIHFCSELRSLPITISRSKVLVNLYHRQFQNIQKCLRLLDEDLQFDYAKDIGELKRPLR